MFKRKKGGSQADASYLKSVPLTRRMTFSIPLQLLVMTIVVIFAMILALSVKMTAMVERSTKTEITSLAKNGADLSADYFETMKTRADALADTLTQLHSADISEQERKRLLENMMRSVLADERIFSVYTAWEPNTLAADTPNGVSYYFYRSQSDISLDIFNDYDIYSESDYYAPAKNSERTHITEPYSYQLTNGELVWLVTISTPMFTESGQFLGVSNCDIMVDTINNLAYDMGGNSSAYCYLLSNEGVFLAHSKDKSLMGTKFGEGGKDTPLRDEILSAAKSGEQKFWESTDTVFGEDSYIVHTPVQISGITTPLSSAFVVTKSEALQEAHRILVLLIGLGVLGIIGLGIGISWTLKKALRPIETVIAAAENMEQGNLSLDFHVNSKNELGYLGDVFHKTALTLRTYIKEISFLMSKMADGDMRISIENEYVGDFAPIQAALQNISNSMNHTLHKIDLAANQVNAGASQVSDASQALAAGATEQAASIEELSASVTKISEQAEENLKNVQLTARLVEEANQKFQVGNSYMKNLEGSMTEIDSASTQISNITKVIEDIAFQTNILALNAAIEAARAGTAGKGFSVVAEEVRELAAKSAKAAKEAEQLIQRSSSMVQDGTHITKETAQILSDIFETASKIGEITQQIETASQEQTAAIDQVSQGLSQISAVVQTNAATSEESSASSEELSAQAEVLHQEMSKFQIF